MYARAVGVAALDSDFPFLLGSPPRIRVKNECVQVCERARWRLVNAGEGGLLSCVFKGCV